VAYPYRNAIFVRPAGGGEAVSISQQVFEPHSLSWSPDGRWIAFVSGNPSYVFGRELLANIAPSAIAVVPASGGAPILLTDNRTLNVSPAWMPDSRRLLFVSNKGGNRDVYEIAITGSGNTAGPARRLTTGLNAMTIHISKDGTRLAYSVFNTKANIWSIRIPAQGEISASEAKPVTNASQTVEGVGISRDGRWLAFDSNRNGNQDIYKVLRSGGNAELLTQDPADEFGPSWSPDGEWIAFHSFRRGNRDVFVMSQDGSAIQQVTTDPAQERYPDWSPDGKRLVFESDKTGAREVYVVSQTNDGGWGTPEQLTADGGVAPKWSPDGERLAYIQINPRALRMIPAGGGTPQTLISASPTLMPTSVAWSPDSGTLYVKAIDQKGTSSFWSLPTNGGTPRLLVRFTDVFKPSTRSEFSTDGSELFFTLTERESDVWVLDLSN
jgi:TolB protein